MFRRRAWGVGSLLAVIALLLAILDLTHVSLGGIPAIPVAVILLALAMLL